MEKMMMIEEEVVIVGGGIAGLATALALKKVGVRSLVLERASELRLSGAALVLSSNAWTALEALGIAHKLAAGYLPYKKTYLINVATGVERTGFLVGTQGGSAWLSDGPRSVHRKALLEALAEELPADTIRFSSKLISIETKHDCTIIVLIGCDGVHSIVAKWFGLKDGVCSGRASVYGIAAYSEGHGLEHVPLQFIHTGKRFGVFPITETDIYWFIDGDFSNADPRVIQENVLERVANFPKIVHDVLQHADMTTLIRSPLKFRYPWDVVFGCVSKGTITVAGDALHPMTPDLGQGGCAALEDAVVLGRHIGNSYIRHGGKLCDRDLETELKMYVKERRWRSASLISASYFAGWVQQGGSGGAGWLVNFFRDKIYYKFLHRRIGSFISYDWKVAYCIRIFWL
ncbi:hypothetical protein MKW94_005928 [Papaver nudicaule]|uniref:FAD-binding domain-containing protein n=1 Tax=Papaver nudicaule TaxID=74823 RepID=A0AA41V5J0_PAPNU|nr:hypothetical protein [Papaver nudicaule]